VHPRSPAKYVAMLALGVTLCAAGTATRGASPHAGAAVLVPAAPAQPGSTHDDRCLDHVITIIAAVPSVSLPARVLAVSGTVESPMLVLGPSDAHPRLLERPPISA